MLVYLDTAQLAELDMLVRKDDPVATAFFREWSELGCVLALSRTHAEEIAQLGDEESLGHRLGVLERFPTLTFNDANHDGVCELEIRTQTLQRLGAGRAEPYRSLRDDLFPFCEPGRFWKFVLDLRPHVLAVRRERQQASALENHELALRRLLTRQTGKRPKLSAITEVDPDLFTWIPLQYEALFQANFNDPFMVDLRERLRSCRGRRLSRRKALVCIYGLEGYPAVSRAPEEDLAMLGWLKGLGERLVLKWCVWNGHPADAVAAALRDFDPYDAPGISVGRAVYRGWKKSDNRRETGDHSDNEHVLSAAHTDVAFVDSRTATFFEQCLRSKPDLLSTHLRTTFRRLVPIKSVTKMLAGTSPR